MRRCTKVACGREAVAACGFSYGDREVWISPLGSEPDPSTYDLCADHADQLRVPKGWTLRDLRGSTGTDLFGRLRRHNVAVEPVPTADAETSEGSRAPAPRGGDHDVAPAGGRAAPVSAEDDDEQPGDASAQSSLLA